MVNDILIILLEPVILGQFQILNLFDILEGAGILSSGNSSNRESALVMIDVGIEFGSW